MSDCEKYLYETERLRELIEDMEDFDQDFEDELYDSYGEIL